MNLEKPVPTFVLGAHAPSREGPGAYRRGMAARWLEHFGRASGDGALLATKVYDEGWIWREGRAPLLSAAQHAMLDDAQAHGFTAVVSYCMLTQLHPGDIASVEDHREEAIAAMRAFLARLPKGTAVIFGNERETAWNGNPLEWFALEVLFGSLAVEFGMQWFVGGDLVEANTIESIRERMVWWARYGVEPAAIAWHSYGQGGTIFRHVRDIIDATHRVAERKFEHVWTEWAYGFVGADSTRAGRTDLATAATGAWCGGFSLALAKAGARGAFFTMDGLFAGPDGEANAAGDELAFVAETGEVISPRVPPREFSKSRTLRYLSAGRGSLSAWWAGLFA